MTAPTYSSRLILPTSFDPPRALHVTEAESDMTMLAAGLDSLVANVTAISPSGLGQLAVGGSGGAVVLLAPGPTGAVLSVSANGSLGWEVLPAQIPAWTEPANEGNVLTVQSGTLSWVAPAPQLPVWLPANDGSFLGVVDNVLSWLTLPSQLPAWTTAQNGHYLSVTDDILAWEAIPAPLPTFSPVTDLGKSLVIGSGGPSWAATLPSPTSVPVGSLLAITSAGVLGWEQIASFLPTIPATLKGQVLTLIQGGGMQWATVPQQFPDITGLTDGHTLMVEGGQLTWAFPNLSSYLTNPMTTAWDIMVGGYQGAAERLSIGTASQALMVSADGASISWRAIPSPFPAFSGLNNGQVLTVVGGALAWEPTPTFMTSPLTEPYDLIIGDPSGNPTRLGIGAEGQLLGVQNGALVYLTAGWMVNPMTTQGDLLVGGASGAPIRMPLGSDGQYLGINAQGFLAWETITMPNPLPSYAGLNGQVLTVQPGGLSVGWTAATWMTSPMTALGDQIVGGTNGAPTAVPVGANGQVWTVNAQGAPSWQNPQAVAIPLPPTVTITTQIQTVAPGHTISWYETIPGGYNRVYGVSITPQSSLNPNTAALLSMYGSETGNLAFQNLMYSATLTTALPADLGQAWYYRDALSSGQMRLSLTNNGPTSITMGFVIVAEPF